jgi:uncharacterized SAM-binding protein YcdF (DUF218 family)
MDEAHPADWLIVFGAAILPTGQPSGSLLRRLQGALAISRGLENPAFMVTGGAGGFGPPEAHVMRDWLLAQGVPAARILVDDQSTDTLDSAVVCARLLKPVTDRVIVCSSGYHNPRCAVLLRMLGFRTSVRPVPSDLPSLGLAKFVFQVCREVVALPWDVLLLLVRHTS